MSRFEETFVIEPISIPGLRQSNFLAVARCLALFVFAFVFPAAANAHSVPSSPPDSVGPGLQFTVGDFDGDHQLDRVGVQVGESSSSGTKYWIDLQLSASGSQSIPVNAARDGIQIAARDVNGDHSLDLVLTTTWLHQPVAILLNDGHGVFRRIAPDKFPGAFHNLESNWTTRPETDRAPIAEPVPSRLPVDAVRGRRHHLSLRPKIIEAERHGLLASPLHTLSPGRAPPTA
jgi:hypothetical protein